MIKHIVMWRFKDEADGRTKLHLHIWGRNSKGEMTTIGWASAFVD